MPVMASYHHSGDSGYKCRADSSVSTELEVFTHMKKIFGILVALSAISIVISGCKKADEASAPADATKTEPAKTE